MRHECTGRPRRLWREDNKCNSFLHSIPLVPREFTHAVAVRSSWPSMCRAAFATIICRDCHGVVHHHNHNKRPALLHHFCPLSLKSCPRPGPTTFLLSPPGCSSCSKDRHSTNPLPTSFSLLDGLCSLSYTVAVAQVEPVQLVPCHHRMHSMPAAVQPPYDL